MNAKVLRLAPRANDIADAAAVTAHPGDIDDAVHLTVHEYKGGAPALAPRCGMNVNTLQLKANPNILTHRLGAKEAVAVMLAADDYRILHALAAAVNHVALPVAADGHGDVSERLAAVGAEVGDVFRQTQQALRDQRITPNERRRLRKEVGEAIAALNGLLKVL